MALSDRLFELRSRKRASKHVVERNCLSFQKASKFALLFTYSSKEKMYDIKRLEMFLKEEGKEAQLFAYLPSKQKPENTLSFSRKDISILGGSSSEVIARFESPDFDYAIYLDQQPNSMCKAMLHRSRAACRTGLFEDKHIFEFMVHTPPEATYAQQLDQLMYYLKKIT